MITRRKLDTQTLVGSVSKALDEIVYSVLPYGAHVGEANGTTSMIQVGNDVGGSGTPFQLAFWTDVSAERGRAWSVCTRRQERPES